MKRQLSSSSSPLCLPAHFPFTSKLGGQEVHHHCLESIQLFWISSIWLPFLCCIKTALITKSYLKAESQSFFSSSSTSPFFLWPKYFSAQCITLPVPSPLPLLFALLFITLFSLWCVFPVPFLTLFTALCTVTISSNSLRLKKCRKNYLISHSLLVQFAFILFG